MSPWRDFASCAGIAPGVWEAIEVSIEETIELHEGKTRRRKAYNQAYSALSICQSCPVIQQCAEWAKRDKYTGVAGGRVVNRGSALAYPR